MPGYYWDTSALVKHYHPELGTAKVDALLHAAGFEWAGAVPAHSEVVSQLCAELVLSMQCGPRILLFG